LVAYPARYEFEDEKRMKSSALSFRFRDVANSADRVNQLRWEIVIDLFPKMMQRDIDDVAERLEVLVPDMLH
jgi:hypothetical protein